MKNEGECTTLCKTDFKCSNGHVVNTTARALQGQRVYISNLLDYLFERLATLKAWFNEKGRDSMRLPELCSWGSTRGPAYICGYWCSGPETLLQGDGLMCFLDLQGKPEEIREQYLSKIYCNPMQALFSFLWLHLKNSATTTVKREPLQPSKSLPRTCKIPHD
jgi:hypothetical protein